jgi:predicted nucleic acid-binding protein
MREPVISNTSPIFYLHRLGLLDLLEKLYGEIIIPNAVLEELEEGKKSGEDVPDVRIISWIKIRSISVPPAITIIPDLGKGESEALALALMEKQHLLIIDDALATEIAGLQSIRFTGTASPINDRNGILPCGMSLQTSSKLSFRNRVSSDYRLASRNKTNVKTHNRNRKPQ